MKFDFGILGSNFFPDSQKCFERKVSVLFTTLLVDGPHHQHYITDINSGSRGSKSNMGL